MEKLRNFTGTPLVLVSESHKRYLPAEGEVSITDVGSKMSTVDMDIPVFVVCQKTSLPAPEENVIFVVRPEVAALCKERRDFVCVNDGEMIGSKMVAHSLKSYLNLAPSLKANLLR